MKIAGIAGACLLISSATLVTYNVYSAKSTLGLVNTRVSKLIETRSLDGLTSLANHYAAIIQVEFVVALDAARTMADVFMLSKSRDNEGLELGRDQINGILLKVLKNNPNFNGTYSCWEPNALDGQDSDFAVAGEGNNTLTGRFTPYWNRDENGNIAVQPLVEYDTQDRHPNGVLKGGWYINPSKDHKESVLDPFPYIVQGKQVWLTTLSVPILVDNKFYGVAGTDYNLDFVQKLSRTVDEELFSGQGEIMIVSNIGLIVAHSERPELIGKHFKEIITGNWEKNLAEIQSGKSAATLNPENNKFEVLAPIQLGRTGKPWSIMIMVDHDTVLADAITLDNELAAAGNTSTLWQIVVGLGTSVAAIILLWYAAGGIVRPIRVTVDMLKDIAEGEGDLTMRLDAKSQDEIGELAFWFNTFIEKVQGIIKRIAENSNSVNSSSDQLSSIARELSTGAEDTSQRAANVATASEEMSANLNSVAAAMEESSTNTNMVASAAEQMTSTINEIAENAERARNVSGKAVTQAKSASEKMQELGEAAQKIGMVTETIKEISEQTNLLALNATIEAARAGEAGKGFAVVANEIKDLAKQTAQATLNIKNQIDDIQRTTGSTVTEIDQITNVISGVNDIVATIAAAVEEQTAATKEIANNINQVSHGIQEVNENVTQSSVVAVDITQDIAKVNSAAAGITESSRQIQSSSEDLQQMATALNNIVGSFKI
jgi:methyl-accepting chemotaxis protein